MPNEQNDLTHVVAKIIREAGRRYVLPRFKMLKAEEIHLKSKGELVTTVDHEMEAVLTEALARLDGGIRIIGEEAVESGAASMDLLGDGAIWLVDPLDGTANFIEGRAPFGVIVALVENGETRNAWLYDPVTDRMCTATAGQGSFLDGEKVFARTTGGALPIASISSQFMDADTRDAVRASAAKTFSLQPIPRCAAAHYPMLVDGSHDVAVFQRTLPWDHAAGALFLGESGGVVTRWDGSPYRIDDGGIGLIAAADQSLHSLMLVTLKDDLDI